jgi:ribosomal protein L37AE/L43A
MKYPSAWSSNTQTTEQQVTATKKIEARIDMSAEVAGVGKCPECKKPMRIVTAAGSQMWTCEADRITLPLPDGYEEKS